MSNVFDCTRLDEQILLLNRETQSIEYIGANCAVKMLRRRDGGGWDYSVSVCRFTRFFYNARVEDADEARAAIHAVAKERNALEPAASYCSHA